MVVALEGTRRLSREYDHSIRAAHFRRQAVVLPVNVVGKDSSSSSSSGFTPFWCVLLGSWFKRPIAHLLSIDRPSWQQQVVRSLFFGIQYGTGALLMLCLMYFNGYVVLFMFLGATVGYFLFAVRLHHHPFSLPPVRPLQACPDFLTLRPSPERSCGIS